MFCLVVVASSGEGARASDLVAGRIGDSPLPGWSVRGPDRDAGIGDWAFGNGTLCAAVSDPEHEGMLYPTGGVLIDVGFCGRADDQWTTFETMWNLSRAEPLEVEKVEAGTSDGRAWVRTRAERDGIDVVTEYSLGSNGERAVRIRSTFRRVRDGPRFFAASLVMLHPSGQIRPFSSFRSAPDKSVGFSYPESDPSSILSLLNAILPIDLHVFVGPDGAPGIAYGLDLVRAERHTGDGAVESLPTMAMTGADSTVSGFFTQPFWVGAGDPPGLLELAQTVLMDLEEGDRIELEWRLWVGDRADVAAVTDQLWPDEPLLRGQVDDPAARVHVAHVEGRPVTQVRVDEEGRFAVRVPPGRYRLTARAEGRPSHEVEVEHSAGAPAQTTLALGAAPATVRLPRDARMRLVFRGVEGTADPVFGDDQLGFHVGGVRVAATQETNAVSLAGLDSDPERVRLAPGTYRVTATRGPEFGVEEVEIDVGGGEEARLAIPEPVRVVETPGWLAADLHVHSAYSFDTAWPLEHQLRSFAAEGGEILVSSEHDRVVDPGPTIDALGLGGVMTGFPGVEVTSVAETRAVPHTLGHLNVFPFEPTRGYRNGAPKGEGRRLREVLAEARAAGSFTQLNHPRASGGRAPKGAFFMHLGIPGQPFDPGRPLDEWPNSVLLEPDPKTGRTDLDFDAIEGMNGADPESYAQVREDWFALLRAGERRTLTANSDSHRASQPVGLPRTYLRLDGGPEDVDSAALIEALREGRAFGTTGPLLRVQLDEADIGELHRGATGTLRITIDAAPWVTVDEVTVFVDGIVAARQPARVGERVEIPLRFDGDAFVTVEVSGEPGEVYQRVAPGFVPFAFTNPIFVDADGDGRWVPDGTEPSPAPESLPSIERDASRRRGALGSTA